MTLRPQLDCCYLNTEEVHVMGLRKIDGGLSAKSKDYYDKMNLTQTSIVDSRISRLSVPNLTNLNEMESLTYLGY